MCAVWSLLVMLFAVPFVELLLLREVPYPGFRSSRESIISELKSVLVLLSVLGFWRVAVALRDGSWPLVFVWFVWILLGFLLISPRAGLVYYFDDYGDLVIARSAKTVLRLWAYTFVIVILLGNCVAVGNVGVPT